ncbi:C69 family dipeptidase [candidate division KSB1 bacterium]|nr:C69 family dipeptidase [candidate division KSB1 bacterium]
MKRWTTLLSIFYVLTLMVAPYGQACTSILVSKGASKSGVPLISYSCDGEFHPHLRMIPAADHQPGDMYEVRGWRGLKGKIPEIPHTYKVFGLMNEHQLAMGETTFGGREELMNPDGLFNYYPLMLITLQRAKTARQALEVMAELVQEHGYCGEGESISIADTEEAWLLEIVGTGKGGRGAVWVAVRIPDGQISATANMSRIHGFPMNDPDNCIYSKNVIEFAVEKGYYEPGSGKAFSFSKAYNPPTEEQIRYSDRRIWSIYRRLAPSQNFSPEYANGRGQGTPYPLFITPDEKVGVRDVIAMHRDHYEGTEFDMTRDLVAGPFGAPDRWRPMKWQVDEQKYVWERPIATQQAGFVYVSEARPHLPKELGGVVWYGVDNPYTNFFIPLYTGMSEFPPSYTRGQLSSYSRDSAWWVVNFVANFANLRYSYMIKDVQALQKQIEDMAFGSQEVVENAAMELLKSKSPEFAVAFLTRYCIDSAEMNVERWRQLGDALITRYNDGYIHNEKHRPEEVGYPLSWLEETVKKEGKRRAVKSEKIKDREL